MKLDQRVQDLFDIELPVIQAPMAGSIGSAMVVAVSEAGGLGSLPCAMLTVEQARTEISIIRQRTSLPINLNFFCHSNPARDLEREAAWKLKLEPYYLELGLDPHGPLPNSARTPFDSEMCEVVEEFRPKVVSFHFGLPEPGLVERVKATGALIMSSATSVGEARWLEDRGCDAIIAQGYEAGGHRGIFLTNDIRTQAGTMALVPQVADAVQVPVIAAGGIADARGVLAAFALGASAVQIGTAYLLCPEAKTSFVHREAIRNAKDDDMVLTNVLTGRPARGIVNRLLREVGPISDNAPEFPMAVGAITPLRTTSETAGSGDFSPLWAGQAAALAKEMPAGDLTRLLASGLLAISSR